MFDIKYMFDINNLLFLYNIVIVFEKAKIAILCFRVGKVLGLPRRIRNR